MIFGLGYKNRFDYGRQEPRKSTRIKTIPERFRETETKPRQQPRPRQQTRQQRRELPINDDKNRTAPIISDDGKKLLEKIYYKDGYIFGRDKLYQYVRANFPNIKISRRQVSDWLNAQEIYQLNKRKSLPKNLKSSVYKNKHKALGIDLVNMEKHQINGYNYLFTGVDLFSRYTYAEALKNKETTSIINAFKNIIEKIGDLKSIRCDNGSEFVSKEFKDFCEIQRIKIVYSKAYAPQSNGAIERLNQSLKYILQKNILLNINYNWVKELPNIVKSLNITIHESLNNKTPSEIEKMNENETKNEYNRQRNTKQKNISNQAFNVGDKVRIYIPSDKYKSLKWSEEIYMVDKVFKPQNDYGVYQYMVNGIKYLKEDLQKILFNVENKIKRDKVFVISKLVKPLIIDGEKHYEVKWKNHKKTTIEPRNILNQDIPKMIKQFETKNKINWNNLYS